MKRRGTPPFVASPWTACRISPAGPRGHRDPRRRSPPPPGELVTALATAPLERTGPAQVQRRPVHSMVPHRMGHRSGSAAQAPPPPRSTDLLTRLRGLAGLALARSSRQDLPHWRSHLVLGSGGASGGDRGLDHGNSLTKVRQRRPDHVDVVALNRLVERRPLDLKTSGLHLAEVAGDGSASGDQCLGVCGGVAPDPRERQGPHDGGALSRRRRYGRLEGPSPRSSGM